MGTAHRIRLAWATWAEEWPSHPDAWVCTCDRGQGIQEPGVSAHRQEVALNSQPRKKGVLPAFRPAVSISNGNACFTALLPILPEPWGQGRAGAGWQVSAGAGIHRLRNWGLESSQGPHQSPLGPRLPSCSALPGPLPAGVPTEAMAGRVHQVTAVQLCFCTTGRKSPRTLSPLQLSREQTGAARPWSVQNPSPRLP